MDSVFRSIVFRLGKIFVNEGGKDLLYSVKPAFSFCFGKLSVVCRIAEMVVPGSLNVLFAFDESWSEIFVTVKDNKVFAVQ